MAAHSAHRVHFLVPARLSVREKFPTSWSGVSTSAFPALGREPFSQPDMLTHIAQQKTAIKKKYLSSE
jgi:hypothetical protein